LVKKKKRCILRAERKQKRIEVHIKKSKPIPLNVQRIFNEKEIISINIYVQKNIVHKFSKHINFGSGKHLVFILYSKFANRRAGV
jgi:hypothetical protein